MADANFQTDDNLGHANRLYFDPREPSRFLVVAGVKSTDNLLAEIVGVRDRSILMAALLLAAALIVAIYMTSFLVRPLRQMTSAATRMASGRRDVDLGRLTEHRDETGELARAFGNMIIEIKSREAELAARAVELERSNQELSQFAYIASHDLQEPLRMVASYLGLLARRYSGKLDAEADEFIAYAVDGAERMKLLITDLLSYSRVSNTPLNKRKVDIAAAAKAVVDSLAEKIEECGAEVAIGDLPTLPADQLMVERLFANVIENALKYRSVAPPRIDIGCERVNEGGVFWVSDNGIGIDPQFQEKVFEIFTRLHGREKYPGTGIGLAACKRIVERHGGEIWVESAPGGGSIFRFTLPA